MLGLFITSFRGKKGLAALPHKLGTSEVSFEARLHYTTQGEKTGIAGIAVASWNITGERLPYDVLELCRQQLVSGDTVGSVLLKQLREVTSNPQRFRFISGLWGLVASCNLGK